MRKTLIAMILMQVLNSNLAYAELSDLYIYEYTRQNGDRVQGHHRTYPDNNPYNNYSSQGNVNPYTHEQGSENPCYRVYNGVIYNTPQCRDR